MDRSKQAFAGDGRLCGFRRLLFRLLLLLLLVLLFILLQLAAARRFMPRIEELGARFSPLAARCRGELAVLRETSFGCGNGFTALPPRLGGKLTVLREAALLRGHAVPALAGYLTLACAIHRRKATVRLHLFHTDPLSCLIEQSRGKCVLQPMVPTKISRVTGA
jgi:hypothetical protein